MPGTVLPTHWKMQRERNGKDSPGHMVQEEDGGTPPPITRLHPTWPGLLRRRERRWLGVDGGHPPTHGQSPSWAQGQPCTQAFCDGCGRPAGLPYMPRAWGEDFAPEVRLRRW